MITPRLLKGFRDYLPDIMIQKKDLINNLENIFENYGFSPINTPALEYSEILLGKGGGETEKQIYRFFDQGKRDIALRFDLTVPLARFVSLHFNKLTFPFKCYNIGPVWRGENTQIRALEYDPIFIPLLITPVLDHPFFLFRPHNIAVDNRHGKGNSRHFFRTYLAGIGLHHRKIRPFTQFDTAVVVLVK